MANKLYEENDIQNIANAIRAKNGSTDKYTVSQMSDAVLNISGGENDTKKPTLLNASVESDTKEPTLLNVSVEVTVQEVLESLPL